MYFNTCILLLFLWLSVVVLGSTISPRRKKWKNTPITWHGASHVHPLTNETLDTLHKNSTWHRMAVTDRFGSRERKVWSNYTQWHLAERTRGRQGRRIKYVCQGAGRTCGGFGNRLWGAIGSLFLGMLSMRAYEQSWTHPVDFSTMFESTCIDISSSNPSNQRDGWAQAACTDNKCAEVFWSAYLTRHRHQPSLSLRMQSPWLLEYLLLKSSDDPSSLGISPTAMLHAMGNKQSTFQKALQGGRQYVYGHLLRYLYRPSADLQKIIDEFQASVGWFLKGTRVIGLHIRTGTAQGEKARVKPQGVKELLNCALNTSKRILLMNPEVNRFLLFLTSDDPNMSTIIRNELKTNSSSSPSSLLEFRLVHLNDSLGPVLHFDLKKTVAKQSRWRVAQAQQRAALEWWLLSETDWLIYGWSSFSMTSSWRSLQPYFRFDHFRDDGPRATRPQCHIDLPLRVDPRL